MRRLTLVATITVFAITVVSCGGGSPSGAPRPEDALPGESVDYRWDDDEVETERRSREFWEWAKANTPGALAAFGGTGPEAQGDIWAYVFATCDLAETEGGQTVIDMGFEGHDSESSIVAGAAQEFGLFNAGIITRVCPSTLDG